MKERRPRASNVRTILLSNFISLLYLLIDGSKYFIDPSDIFIPLHLNKWRRTVLEDSHPWIPNSPKGIVREMLKVIGVDDVEELYSDIPKDLMLNRPLRVGRGRPLSELEVLREVNKLLERNRGTDNVLSFLGAGCWPHYVPSVVKEVIRRGEFYTSYTPYQPEISQGLCQAMFEYQSMIASLTGMDVVNASMYDGSTALAEAVLMAVRVTGRREVLVPSTSNPEYREVLRTLISPKGIKVYEVPYEKERGLMDLEALKGLLSDKVAAVYLENPSYLGFVEEKAEEIVEMAHEVGALAIVGVDPLSLGVFRPPGDYGADIVVGEGQPLGLGLNFGGPLLGIFAVKWDSKLIRQMPGRIFGATTTLRGGEVGYSMVLQTREQHIRRERATSNICTNEALSALAAAVYLALLGPKGLRRLGETILYYSHYATKRLNEVEGVKAPLFKAAHFKEFVVSFEKAGVSVEEVDERLAKRGIQGGKPLKKEFPELGEAALYCVTEVHRKADIDRLVATLKEVLEVGG